MLYAKVVLGLPVDLAFDYSVPADLHKTISAGARVLINFRNKKSVGYVVGFTHKTEIKNIKAILGLIDEKPLLGKNMLLVARKLSEYYCSSYGEAIEAMLPEEVRRGKPVKNLILGDAPQRDTLLTEPGTLGSVPVLLHDLEPCGRFDIYLEEIKKAQDNNKSAIVLFSGIFSALKAKAIFEKVLGREVHISYRKQPGELESWENIHTQDLCVVLGTRSAIFAPVNNLGLIILDHEEDSVYKQEQVPHYHARQAALMRAEIEGAKLILESISPSLESYYLYQKNKISYRVIPRKKIPPEVKLIDTKRMAYAERKSKAIFFRTLSDAIFSILNSKGKTLVFLNRKGFATYAACHNCGVALKCPACNISLVYHFDQDILRCHHCSFKMAPPKICPNCNAGYIKYFGTGTAKIESELNRQFPQARIKRVDALEDFNIASADIFVSTSLILKEEGCNFDLICVLNIDNLLNRVDYMAAEKVFYLLSGLAALTDKKIIIPTSFPGHHCFKALLSGDHNIFYGQELKYRKQLKFPPYKHMGLVKLRGKDLDKVKKAAQDLFALLKEGDKVVKALSLNPGQPEKLRGNFYWQILFSALSARKLTKFLKMHIKEFRYSGIIVTVDLDPI
ncbi:MAG: primosomal protein N' [Candidatus Omnitrophica bacterium CG08_land_8_20_14_0_20_41_16]|nr:MAG: primosomal protein N' [Candidatus Omnitrophica bacterium CG08_land_8_20_14_0_20_41_16]